MATYVHWGDKIIYVDRDDLAQVQSTPVDVRRLDLDVFRLELRDLEDEPLGMPHIDTHVHNPPLVVSGTPLARVVEIINDYTVTFLPDEPWQVDIAGGNSNVADRVNPNNVGVRSSNSAGLTDLSSLLGISTETANKIIPHIWGSS